MAFEGAVAGAKPYIFMVLLQIGFAGMYVVAVASLKHGMSHFVLVVYRNIVAAVVMAPFALWFERKGRPRITISVFIKITLLAILEPVLDQNLYYMGSNMTSAGFASALINILPALTFIIAILFRMEKLRLRERRSQAKIFGTLLTVCGALLMILYKGPVVGLPWNKASMHHGAAAAAAAASQGNGDWLKGTIMVLLSCCCWSAFFILQANTLDSYPAELSLTVLICALGALLNGAVTLVAERGNMKTWKIGSNMQLFTVIYAGVVCSGIAYYVQGIVSKERGPVFVTAFNPLCMIITALLGSFILKEEITLGSIIGAAIIVAGLYSLIWGKGKDHLSMFGEEQNKNAATEAELPVVVGTSIGIDGKKKKKGFAAEANDVV